MNDSTIETDINVDYYDCYHREVCADTFKDVLVCIKFKNKNRIIELSNVGSWETNEPNDLSVYCNECYIPQDMPLLQCPICGTQMI